MRGRVIVTLLAAAAGCTKSADQPDLRGQDVHLTVIHTADLHSRIFPYQFAPGQIDKGLGLVPKHGDIAVVGGAARIATVVANERAASDRVIHLDSGDIFEGAPVFNLFTGEAEMRAWTRLNVSAMALGNHEFDKGTTNLELMKEKFGGFPILAANYNFADPTDPTQPKLRDVIAPFTILNANGLKIGVIGMGNLSSLLTIIEGGNSLGIRPVDATQALAAAVKVLRPQVDLLVVLSHLGLDEDEAQAQTDMNVANMADQNEALSAIAGIDVIFGGHLHIVLNPPKLLDHTDENGKVIGHTILCHSGAFAKYVGRLDLVVHVADPNGQTDEEKKSFVKSYTYKLIPIDDSIPEDAGMANMLEPYQIKMNTALNLTQNYAIVPCANTQSTCPKVVRNDPDGGDSQLGNLVATAMRLRKRVEADFGLTNSLGIRADFESGPLNLEEMYNVFPFDNTITTMYLSGDEIQRMIDDNTERSAQRGCKSQAQVSGLWYLMDCANVGPNGFHIACGPFDAQGRLANRCHPEDRTLDGPMLVGDNCIQERVDAQGKPTDPSTWRCKFVLPASEYRAAVNDYIAAGGSGFIVLKNNTTKFNTGISLRDALIDYIRAIPESYPDAVKQCDPSQNSNIVYDAQDITEKPVQCTSDGDCAPDHHCLTDPALPADTRKWCLRHYDFSGLPCLNFDIQSHDGRISAGHSS